MITPHNTVDNQLLLVHGLAEEAQGLTEEAQGLTEEALMNPLRNLEHSGSYTAHSKTPQFEIKKV